MMAVDFSNFASFFGGALAAGIGGLFPYLGARSNARSQERAAERRVQGDLELQAQRLHDAAVSADVILRRAKLEETYAFLSEVGVQCSQTQAMLDHQSKRKLEDLEARWQALLARLHPIRAVVSVCFPDIVDKMSEVAKCINHFNWENREFLQTDHVTGANNEPWRIRFGQIIEISSQTSKAVWAVQQALGQETKRLVVTFGNAR